ncbi:MAG: hypothetical protein KF850_28025 [Labilithrix sp.]|nr:hypothetical protein [Labilithrix sp.]
MMELPRAVDDLVAAAARAVEPRALKSVVERVLDAFDQAPEAERNAALRSIGGALGKLDGRGAQILSLALGALVESGASPELAWPAVGDDLADLLDRATAFARAAVAHAKDEDVESAIESAGAAVAKKRPRDGEAWKALPSRCLAAVACLTRSRTLRNRARKNPTLETAAWPLSDVISEVGYLLQALRIVDDETLVVLLPDAARGWRVTLDAMPSNAELYILLADALLAPKAGGNDRKVERLLGARPDPKAVAAIREGTLPPKRVASSKVPFQLVSWTALAADGSLPRSDASLTDHWIWMEGLPADIPVGPEDERVVLVQAAPKARALPIAPSFESLRPDVQISGELPGDDVASLLRHLGRAAARLRPADEALPSENASARPARKKPTSKKPAAKKPTSKKPAAKKPKPAAKKPAAKKPKPAAKKPTSKKPTPKARASAHAARGSGAPKKAPRRA